MNTKMLVKEINVEKETIFLYLQDQAPLVECQNQRFANIWLLVNHVAALSRIEYIKEFAEISNFFWKGIEFQFIHSIAHYQKQYQERVALEKMHPADVFEYRLTDFKIFDVSSMHDPKVEHQKLIYFVYNINNGLPYRVVCPFPYTISTSTLVHYQLLPLLN